MAGEGNELHGPERRCPPEPPRQRIPHPCDVEQRQVRLEALRDAQRGRAVVGDACRISSTSPRNSSVRCTSSGFIHFASVARAHRHAMPRSASGEPRRAGHPRPRGVEAQDSQEAPAPATNLMRALPAQMRVPQEAARPVHRPGASLGRPRQRPPSFTRRARKQVADDDPPGLPTSPPVTPPGYNAAFVLEPDGNTLAAVFRER